MKKYFAKIILILISFLFLASGIKEVTEEFITEQFGNDVIINFEKFLIPEEIKKNIEYKSEQRFYSDHIYVWKIMESDSLKAIGLMDNVLGKSLPITFLVVFNLEGTIITSSIVKYREPYGGGVSTSSWIKQFEGKNYKSSFDVGTDIQGISGATISVNSVSKGIKKLTILFNEIKKINE